MIRSMTGFGSASDEVNGAHYVIELRSLNNRFFKAQVRLPEELQGLEGELESMLAKRFTRGSVVLTARFSDSSARAAGELNTQAIQRYLDQLRAIPGLDGDAAQLDVGALLDLPGVLVTDTGKERMELSRPVIVKLVSDACDKLLSMREREGQTLHSDLHKHRKAIGRHLQVIIERSPGVVEEYRKRLQQRVNSLLSDAGATVSDGELIREVAIYAERTDIAEEVARLAAHLEQFAEIIDANEDEPSGRTLDFLSQEMLREANTIASKSMDVEISRQIVEVKGLIDRIKEQAQNVE